MINILCSKYEFDSDIEIQEVNFFTDLDNYSLVSTIDLYDYIIENSLSPIEITVETVDDDKKLFFETSQVTMKCFNDYVGNVRLSEFFQLYNQEVFFKYLINIKYNNDVVYTGVLYPENIRMIDREQELLDITVVGIEKEFKEYYSNKYIPSLPSSDVSMPTQENHAGFNSSGLDYHLRNTFFTAEYLQSIKLIGIGGQYYIIHRPYLFRPDNKFINDEIFCKVGYECYQREEYNLYDFFKSICLSMGWVWYFENRVMVIRNRYDITNFPILEIDYNSKFIKHDVENQLSEMGGDNIMIDDGEFWSNGYLLSPTNGHTLKEIDITGNRRIVLSDKNVDTVTTNPFKQLVFISESYEINYSDFKVYKFGEENLTNINLKEVYCYPSFDPTNIIENNKSYNASMTLKVNPIINSRNNGGMINIVQARTSPDGDNYGNGNYFTTNISVSDNTFAYRGNPGNCLMKYNLSTHKVENYQYYITTTTFKNNFKPLLKSKLQLLLTIEYEGIITNPSYIVKINNYPYTNQLNSYLFSVQKIKFDLLNNKTILSVVKIEE